MNQESDFPFERARRVTPEENQKFRQAISQQFGIKLRNRDLPVQNDDEKVKPIAIAFTLR
jgi:hypothetical protein